MNIREITSFGPVSGDNFIPTKVGNGSDQYFGHYFSNNLVSENLIKEKYLCSLKGWVFSNNYTCVFENNKFCFKSFANNVNSNFEIPVVEETEEMKKQVIKGECKFFVTKNDGNSKYAYALWFLDNKDEIKTRLFNVFPNGVKNGHEMVFFDVKGLYENTTRVNGR